MLLILVCFVCSFSGDWLVCIALLLCLLDYLIIGGCIRWLVVGFALLVWLLILLGLSKVLLVGFRLLGWLLFCWVTEMWVFDGWLLLLIWFGC